MDTVLESPAVTGHALVRTEFPRLRRSVAAALVDPTEFGARFHGELFRRAPHLRALFPRNLDIARLEFALLLRAIVEGLDYPNQAAAELRRLGARLRQLGIRESDYDDAGAALTLALAERLGPAFDTATRSAWLHLSMWLVSHLRRG